MSGEKIQVIGLKELNKGLKGVGPGMPKVLQKTNKSIANLVVGPAKARLGGHTPRAGSRAAGTIRALASGTRAQVALGSAGVPWAVGHNFGSSGKYKQFPPRAEPDHALYATIRAMRSQITDAYGDAIDELVSEAFPE